MTQESALALLAQTIEIAKTFSEDPTKVIFAYNDGLLWVTGVVGDDGETITFSQPILVGRPDEMAGGIN